MSSVIGGMEEDIARTMAQLGWPGADQVQPEDDNAPDIIEPEEPIDNQQAPEEISPEPDTEEPPAEEPEEVPETPAAEQPYQPKWKKAALEVLSQLPPEQAELLRLEDKRREENFHKGIEQYRSGHQESKEWSDVVAPYRATIDRFQVKPQEAVRTLLATDHTLRYGQRHEKVGLMFQVMSNYGIDPADIVGVFQNVNQQQGEPLDPRIAQMQQKLAGFEQQQYNQQREAQEREQRAAAEQQRAANEMIERFAQDPDHEHFELLKPLMGGYLQQGAAKDMDEAYEMALRAHPQTANIWIAQQQKQWAESRKAVAEKAKKVTNVRSNGRASASGPTVAATMDETIAREAKRLGLA
jgi:hypothetical protein